MKRFLSILLATLAIAPVTSIASAQKCVEEDCTTLETPNEKIDTCIQEGCALDRDAKINLCIERKAEAFKLLIPELEKACAKCGFNWIYEPSREKVDADCRLSKDVDVELAGACNVIYMSDEERANMVDDFIRGYFSEECDKKHGEKYSYKEYIKRYSKRFYNFFNDSFSRINQLFVRLCVSFYNMVQNMFVK